ncbi:hypothetical protein GGR20_002004 [Devosia subaequoris]|uniref:Outer membrane beta-barrel protein n=1 Tax=Devosia subaequoris TaxID=395930 RepID=A0A7W6NC39_9HYPH|nr:outer membrane beta-barrel protein [Devosia subaequoris]MBB4052361.1 hypothetical protein [Devosia subaequoris]MCP1209522.1 outer membrane beta-barrel protein [Devosia subaequoris]
MARHELTVLRVLLVSTALAGSALADPPIIDETSLREDRLTPGLYPAAPVPDKFAVPNEPGHPPFEVDWSIGLKGSYSNGTSGERFITTLNPAVSAIHQGVRTDLVLEGAAELARDTDGTLGATALDLDVSGTTRIDRDTTASGGASLSLSRDLPSAPGLDPVIIEPPLSVTGSINGGIDRQLGKFNLGLDGTIARTVYGPTRRSDTGVTDNSSQNVWEGDASLRLGLQATPIIEVFAEAGLGRDWYDQAGAGGTKADATSRTLRAGLAGQWNGLVSASASIGVGHHDFDDGSLSDITTRLYDASITYSPDPTLNLSAALATTVEPTGTDSTGTARVAHTATARFDYTVNSWLRLRASADWARSWLEGSAETEQRHGAGLGADYKVNAHTAVSADYGYAHRDNSASGVRESHTVSLGVTVRR